MTEPEWTRPQKLSDGVVETLRTMILTGRLPPGIRTTQVELAKRLGVSTMPVREALLRLAAEGFVEAVPNRSFSVIRTSRDDIRDVYRVHAVLAGELARRACASADDDFLTTLQGRERHFSDTLDAKDAAASDVSNWDFHRIINEEARSPKLTLLLRTTLRFIPHGFYSLIPQWNELSRTGHRTILEAFLARDPEAARASASDHVLAAGEMLLSSFSNSGYWTKPDAGDQPVEEAPSVSTMRWIQGGPETVK